MLRRSVSVTGVLLFCTVLVAGCANVKDKVITQENQNKIFDEIKDSHDLTAGEVELLVRRSIKTGMANAFGAKQECFPVGKTLGQVIEEERAAEIKAAQEQHEEKERQEKAESEDNEVRQTMREALAVTVYEKGFHPSNVEEGNFRDELTFKVEYQNTGKEQIRGFKGDVLFNDLFGKTISRVSLQEESPLAPGAKRKKVLGTDFNQFRDSDVTLRNTDLKNMAVVWQPDTILFSNGKTLSIHSAE